jgi:hypothetical protein
MNDFIEMFSATDNKSFNSFLDVKRNLLLQERFSENCWEIVPYTNEGVILNKFYNAFNNGIQGTKEECLKQIENYDK